MFGKKKLTAYDISHETTAYLETLSDQELLDRAEAKALAKRRAEWGEHASDFLLPLGDTEEYQICHARREKKRKAKEEREKKRIGFAYSLRRIFFTPIASAVNLIGFICEIVAKISFVGLIAGVYYLYQSFCAMKNGVPFAEVDTFGKAISLIIFPFIAYGVAEILDVLYRWCRKMCRG